MRIKFWLTGATAVIETLCFSGIIYGWGSLSFILQEEGYFNSSCNASVSINQSTICPSQQQSFSLVFTVSSISGSLSTVLLGYILDKYGTWVMRTTGATLYLLGFLVVALTTRKEGYLLYPTTILIACSGFAVLLSNIPVGNLFPERRWFVVTLINGSFDTSAIIFALVKLAYEGGIAFSSMMYFFTFCSILLILRTFLLMPKGIIPYEVRENFEYGIAKVFVDVNNSEESSKTLPLLGNKITPVFSLKNTVLSATFILNMIYVGILQLRNQFFFGTVDDWLLNFIKGGDKLTQSRFVSAFGITQLLGIIVAPLNGIVLDSAIKIFQKHAPCEYISNQKAVSVSLFMTSLQAALFSTLVLIPVLNLQYISFFLQVLFRSFVYGSLASFIITCYPSEHFGKLYGLTIVFAAVINALQFPLFYVVNTYFDGDFFVVNVILLCASISTFAHPIALFLKTKAVSTNERKFPVT